MTLKNSMPLTIETLGFNLVAKHPSLLAQLRKLTLERFSGMNYELDRMTMDAEDRTVNCEIVLAYLEEELVAWALVSKESTNFCFVRSQMGFSSDNGILFQVYVNPNYRRLGIASELFKKAKEIFKDENFYVCPWDQSSTGFYTKHNTDNTKWL